MIQLSHFWVYIQKKKNQYTKQYTNTKQYTKYTSGSFLITQEDCVLKPAQHKKEQAEWLQW
jgi:hypothetical protein